MSNFAWAILENIFWGSVAVALFFFAGDGWWRLTALVPLLFVSTGIRAK